MPDDMKQTTRIFYFKKGPKNLCYEALYFFHEKAILPNFELIKNKNFPTLGIFFEMTYEK